MPVVPGIRLSLLAAAAAMLASPALGADPAPLPLKYVRLYETGVGYFERMGPLEPGVGLPVPAGHLDDALKTLVVLSQDPEARISGIEFASSLSPGRARSLAGLPGSEDGSPLGLHALLRSLRGENVEVATNGARVVGRLVEVLNARDSDLESCVRKARRESNEPERCVPERRAALVVLGAAGDIRRVSVDDVVNVRPTEPEPARRLRAALDTAFAGNARAVKELKLLARGKKRVTIGYVAEAPVWRANYRLVLGDAKSAHLQGWTLVHNDTDEAWRGVHVEIVNGQPDSFLFPLAAPRYGRRELVTPEQELTTLPQLGDTTPDQLWGDEVPYGYGIGIGLGRGLSGIGAGGGGRGEGHSTRSPRVRMGATTVSPGSTEEASTRVSVGDLAGFTAATGAESGALFRFRLAEPVDLRAHGSVLAPFLQETMEATRVAVFRLGADGARSAVRLSHRGAQTLPSGTLAVFDAGGFAGETVLPRMKPKATELVEFGADLDVDFAEKEDHAGHETRLLALEDELLVEHFVRRRSLRYEIQNKSSGERLVSIELAVVNNAKLHGTDDVFFDTRSSTVFAGFVVPKHDVSRRVLTTTEGLVTRSAVKWLAVSTLRRLGAQSGLPAKQRKLVGDALAFALERDRLARTRDAWQEALDDRGAEVERLRQHAKAVGTDASEDIAERLLDVEDDIKVLRRRVGAFRDAAAGRDRRVVATLRRL